MPVEFKHRVFMVSLAVQAAFYCLAGLNHFWHATMYVSFMPRHYSHPHALVLLSGAAEILGGIGLMIAKTRRTAAWGIILMLVIYLDVHIFMLTNAQLFPTVPIWILYLRFPVQFLLIGWSWIYTRKATSNS